jgi:hypothetical protein
MRAGGSSTSSSVLLRAAALGAAAAMRSVTPLAALSRDLAARGDAEPPGRSGGCCGTLPRRGG